MQHYRGKLRRSPEDFLDHVRWAAAANNPAGADNHAGQVAGNAPGVTIKVLNAQTRSLSSAELVPGATACCNSNFLRESCCCSESMRVSRWLLFWLLLALLFSWPWKLHTPRHLRMFMATSMGLGLRETETERWLQHGVPRISVGAAAGAHAVQEDQDGARFGCPDQRCRQKVPFARVHEGRARGQEQFRRTRRSLSPILACGCPRSPS